MNRFTLLLSAFTCSGLILLSNADATTTSYPKMSLEDKIAVAKTRCTPPQDDEPYFFMDMFNNLSTPAEVDQSYDTVYNQKERLFNRAGYDLESKTFITKSEKVSVTLPEHFLKSIILHVENALRLKYVKYVFFSDMGHSHILIPEEEYNKKFRSLPPTTAPGALNYLLNAKGLKSLYHTAEHFKFLDENGKLLDDWYTQWRFYTRNPVIDSKGQIELFTNRDSSKNTVRKVPGYRWSFGISLSAHKNGCFPFEDADGKVQYFDVSAWDPPHDCLSTGCWQKRRRGF